MRAQALHRESAEPEVAAVLAGELLAKAADLHVDRAVVDVGVGPRVLRSMMGTYVGLDRNSADNMVAVHES